MCCHQFLKLCGLRQPLGPSLCPLCAAVKGDVTCFARVFVTDQCLQFVGCASTLLDRGSRNPALGSWKPADVAVCLPSVRLPGLRRLTQPQIEPMTTNLRFLVHPASCSPAHPTTHLHSQFVTMCGERGCGLLTSTWHSSHSVTSVFVCLLPGWELLQLDHNCIKSQTHNHSKLPH